MMRNPFVISGIVWHEIGDKIAFENANAMEDLLNEHIDLSSYGSGVTAIAVIFIAVQPNNTTHKETVRYSPTQKEIYIQKKLPFDLVREYGKPQVLHLMAATYLQILDELEKRRIHNFDLARFQQNVRQLFEAQGWLAQESVS